MFKDHIVAPVLSIDGKHVHLVIFNIDQCLVNVSIFAGLDHVTTFSYNISL